MKISYVAGLFDGEGCVHFYIYERARKQVLSVTRPRTPAGLTADAFSTQFAVSLAGTYELTIRALCAQFGGSVHVRKAPLLKPGAPQARKQLYHWWIRGNEAEAFMRKVAPHLIEKREQMRLALKARQLRSRYGRRSISDKAKIRLKDYAAQIKALKTGV